MVKEEGSNLRRNSRVMRYPTDKGRSRAPRNEVRGRREGSRKLQEKTRKHAFVPFYHHDPRRSI